MGIFSKIAGQLVDVFTRLAEPEEAAKTDK